MRQSLTREKAFQILRAMEGEITTDLAARALADAGCLEDDLWNYQKTQARSLLEQYRSRCEKTRDIQEAWINVWDMQEDPDTGDMQKVQRWKKFKAMSNDDHAKHLGYWFQRIQTDQKKFYLYFDELPANRRRAVQRMLPFDLPSRPDLTEEDQTADPAA